MEALQTRRRVRALVRRLEKVYGPFEPKPATDPLDGLILTILSQATNDTNSRRAFARLRERFPRWEQVRDAPAEQIEAAIRPGGLARNKARTIREVLRILDARPEGLSLDHLAERPTAEAMDLLTALPGVGTKTASCVLLFDLGRPVMPVDTHVHRLARRLGLVRDRATADQTHAALMKITPPELVYRFHIWLIAHGRAVCRSQRPTCRECALRELCPSRDLNAR